MAQVAFNLNWKNKIAKDMKPFQDAYAAKFGGRAPFINPFPAAGFTSAADVTDTDVENSYGWFTFFRDWFGSKIMLPDANICSENLFLILVFAGDVVNPCTSRFGASGV